MADDPRVELLLDRLLDSDAATPEEVCASCIDLLPVVRDRWRQVCAARAELDDLLPPPSDAAAARPGGPAGDGTPLPDLPGYDVEAVAGRGGMGVVFRARQVALNRVVAVKMGLAGAYGGPVERERLWREAEAVAALRHPNVVQVYDAGEADGRPYMAMEYVDGGSLAQRLGGAPLPAREAAALVAAVAGGVEAAHRAGIIHRDLKPGNVLIAADGSPKVSDFGLARWSDGRPGLTRTGAALGTPGYMAPEQARGDPAGVGPAADVYALGAILYECLTGRPPVDAASAADAIRQLLADDPSPPAKFNPKIPRDLETVCLTCLRKEPRHRYTTAAALADDLGRFLRGEAIAARPERPVERLVRRIRRRPALAVAAATGVLLATILAGGGLWVWRERAEAGRAQAELDLVEQGRRDRALADRLAAVAADRIAVTDGRYDQRVNNARADRAYEAAFREAGLGGIGEDAAEVGARVAASAIRPDLLAALDDWALCVARTDRVRWVPAVARAADPTPSAWRNRVRDPATLGNAVALAALAAEADVRAEPPILLAGLGNALRYVGHDATAFLRTVREAHPTDYWANASLASALRTTSPAESLRYFQAAEALRPGEVAAVGNLGCALLANGQAGEAVTWLRRAVDLAPAEARNHVNLAHALVARGDRAAAVDAYRRALALDPGHVPARTRLGVALVALGNVDAALAEFREAARIDPEYAPAHDTLGSALAQTGRSAEALEHLREAVRLDPKLAGGHANLAKVLRSAGRLDEAISHAEKAVELAPASALFRYNLGTYLKAAGRRDEAAAQFEQAQRADPGFAPAHQGLGGLRLEDGRPDDAVELLRRAVALAPDDGRSYGALGAALLAQGRLAEARAVIARGVELFVPNEPTRAAAERQLKQCDAMIALDDRLPAVVRGEEQPAGPREGLQFALLCRLRKQYVAAARLATEAFERSPALADDLRTQQRYEAACAAALAGRGAGGDALQLDAVGRTRWRRQAVAWLRADLGAWAKAIDRGPQDRAAARRALAHWRIDPDLAGVRDPAELDRLPADERADCAALWTEVGALSERIR